MKQEPNFSSWPNLELNRACEWCSSPDYMRELIKDYLEKPLDEWQELLLDLCYCYDCVQEYHRLAHECISEEESTKEKFLTLDIERLTQIITRTLEAGCDENVPIKLEVPLMEILGYPYFLHHKQLAEQFVNGMVAVLKCNYPFKLEDKLPGAYLLLIHPCDKVRAWATRIARGKGLISPDDYDLLVVVIKWMLGVVEFDIGSNGSALEESTTYDFLPAHLFVPPSSSEYWTGLVVFVMQMDALTVQSCLMSSDENGHREFLSTIVSNMSDQMEDEGHFWSVLQCFTIFLEKLGERIWQMPGFHSVPSEVFDIITLNIVYTNYIQKRQDESEVKNVIQAATNTVSKRRSYKTALVWFWPFVESLLVFDSAVDCVSQVLTYLHDVAVCCSLQSTFKIEVQSSLLTIIHSLVCKQLSPLLGRTVQLWAGDILDVAMFGAADKKRQFLHLLKICHRHGQRNALEYSDMFSRGSLPTLSDYQKMEIISILIQRFESDSKKLFMLGENTIAQSSLPLRIMEMENENDQQSHTFGNEGVTSLFQSKGTDNSCVVVTTQNHERKEEHLGVCSANSVTIDESRSVAGEPKGELRKRKIDPTVRSWGKAGPSTRVSSSEDDGDEHEYSSMVVKTQNDKRTDETVDIFSGNCVTMDERASSVTCEQKSEALKRKIDPSETYLRKAGRSNSESSSEDGNDKQEEYWTKMKRRKKLKSHHRKVKEPERLLATKVSPLIVKMVDYRLQGKTKKELLLERQQTKRDSAVNNKTKVPAKDYGAGAKIKEEGKRRFFARKSTGRIKKHASKKGKNDRRHDSEDDVKARTEQKDPFSKNVISNEMTEDYFFQDSEDLDTALGEMLDTIESKLQLHVVTTEPETSSKLSKIPDSSYDLSESSDEELLQSVFEKKSESTASALKVNNEMSLPETAGSQESFLIKEERRQPVRQLDTVLYPELMAPEVPGDVHYNFEDEEGDSSSVQTISEDTQSLWSKHRDFENRTLHNNAMTIDSLPEMVGPSVGVPGSVHKNPAIQNERENKEFDNELKTVQMQVIPEDLEALSSISRKLENPALDDGIANIWGYNEMMFNSQESVLASIEDDLEDVCGMHAVNADGGNALFSIENGRDVNDEAIKENAIEQMRYSSDPNTSDLATTATASSVHPVVSLTRKPAIITPKKDLTEDEFFLEILNWKVQSLEDPENNKKHSFLPRKFPVICIPERSGFDSMDQYHDTFKPLLFMEIWAKAVNDWMEENVSKKKVSMEVSGGGSSNKMSLITCWGIISLDQRNKVLFPVENDLVVVSFNSSDTLERESTLSGMPDPPVFGIVEKVESTAVKSSQRTCLGSSSEEDAADSSTFHLTLQIKTSSKFRPPRKSLLSLKYVTSLLTSLRQWAGLMSLPKSLLASDILRPRRADNFCINDYQHCTDVSKSYNPSQEKVISCATNGMHLPYPIPRICLVQGPPGTGKSYTIVGLIKEILERRQELPTQPATGQTVLAEKYRILLCAPSNAAIDELICQIKRAKMCLHKRQDNKENTCRRSNGQKVAKRAQLQNCGDLSLVRIGRKSQVHQSVMEFWLENISKERIKERRSTSTGNGNVNVNALKDNLNLCTAKVEQVEKKLWELTNSPLPAYQDKIKKLQEEKDALKSRKKRLQISLRQEKEKQSNLYREEARIRREILESADIVCTTLSGAGSSSLKHDYKRRRLPFACVIVDEACQATELDVLIPLEFKASKLVLVGDPEQLPPTVISEKAKANAFGLSMFQRLYKFFRHNAIGRPVLMLEQQYRMHPQIAEFPSRYIYSSRLKTPRSLESRQFPLKEHYAVFDVFKGQEEHLARGSLWNPAEVDLVVALCKYLVKVLDPGSIGIITPYRKQKTEIQSRLNKDLTNIEVNTVDGFQGREKDVIILSCVRAKNDRGSIGFVGDRQRMNVALTRARHALYIFGDMKTLKRGSDDWMALTDDAKKRGCIFAVESNKDLQSHLSIDVTQDLRFPADDPPPKASSALRGASDGAYTSTEHRSLEQEKRERITFAATTTDRNSLTCSEKFHPVPVLRKGKTSQDTVVRMSSRKRVTWADKLQQKAIDNDFLTREGTACGYGVSEQAKEINYETNCTNRDDGKESSTLRKKDNHEKSIEWHSGGSGNFHNSHGSCAAHLNSEGRSSHDPGLEQHRWNLSNSSQPRHERTKQNRIPLYEVCEGQKMDHKEAFHMASSDHRDLQCADQLSSKGPIRHWERIDLGEEKNAHHQHKRDQEGLPHVGSHGHNDQHSSKGLIELEQGLNSVGKWNSYHPSNQGQTRHGSGVQNHISVYPVSDEQGVNQREVDDMAVQEPSAIQRNEISVDTNLIRGEVGFNEYLTDDDMDTQDYSLDSMDTQESNVDPILNSVVNNNHSSSPDYFANLQKQSASERTLIATSIGSSAVPTTPVLNNAPSSRHLTATFPSSSTHSLGRSWTSKSRVDALKSSFSSSFSGQMVNLSRSSNHQASLGHTRVGQRSSSIQGELDPSIQERVNAVSQRHPRSRGPEIIEPGSLFRGIRNPLGGAKQRTALVDSKDVSSLRARAVGEETHRTEQKTHRRRGIDKKKVYQNFRGQKSWKK